MDTVPYLDVGRMYILLIDKEPQAGEQAILSISKALDLNKRNPRIWYEMGQAQLSLKKYNDSYNSFKQALDLNPNVITSWWFTGIAAYSAEYYEEAVSNVEKAIEMGYEQYKNRIADIMRLVNIYEKVGRYDKVVEFYNLAVEEQPENPQIYASLAVAYAKIGDYNRAIEAALKSAEIDPEFKDESDAFIKSLGL